MEKERGEKSNFSCKKYRDGERDEKRENHKMKLSFHITTGKGWKI